MVEYDWLRGDEAEGVRVVLSLKGREARHQHKGHHANAPDIALAVVIIGENLGSLRALRTQMRMKADTKEMGECEGVEKERQ